MAHISEGQVLQISRFYTGWFSYRNPLIVPIRTMGRRIIELYDALWDGLNMECSNRLTLARRPGFTPVNTHPINGTALWFTTFKPSNFPGQLYNLVDTTQDIEWIQPGSIAPTVLLTKTVPTLTTFKTVGAFQYWANSHFMKKWDSPAGVQGLTNWGIDITSLSSPNGPHSPGTGALLPSLQAIVNPAWTISGPGSVTVSLPRPDASTTLTSKYFYSSGFGFNLPVNTATVDAPEISGFTVQITGLETAGQGISLNVGLVRNGAINGLTHNIQLPANSTTVTIGRSSDLWGGSWTPNDVNKSSFGVAIQAVNSSSMSATYTITGITVTVYTIAGPTVTIAGSIPSGQTGITAQVGYQYVICYGNAYSGHISSPSPPAPPTILVNVGIPGIAPANQAVQIVATVSPDPQVTDIHIFRTSDGGGEPFYELPNSPVPNTADGLHGANTVTVVDTAQDWQLQIANIAPNPHFNDPPPQGAVDPQWYGGRLWLHKKNLLYFASGPDCTMGNGQEAWFPEFVFEIPGAEIIRKFPLPTGMLVVSVDDIYIVRGTSAASYTVTDFIPDIGIRTWTAGDTDGTNVYLYSTDKQCLLINANGLSSVSQNIADKIEAVDPTLAYLSLYRYTARQNFLFVGDGSVLIYPFNVELQAWGLPAAPINGAGAIATVETQPGVFQLWRARPVNGSLISYRDTTSWADEGTPYPCFVTFGAIPTADFLTVSQIRDIVVTVVPTTSQWMISVLANEIAPIADKQFQLLEISSSEPPELSATPSLSYYANRYSWKTAPLPEFTNLVFLRIDFSANDFPDNLLEWTIGGTQTTGGSSLGQAGQLPQIQGR